jgi:hypothetical protein
MDTFYSFILSTRYRCLQRKRWSVTLRTRYGRFVSSREADRFANLFRDDAARRSAMRREGSREGRECRCIVPSLSLCRKPPSAEAVSASDEIVAYTAVVLVFPGDFFVEIGISSRRLPA